jgi:hypothetical protein
MNMAVVDRLRSLNHPGNIAPLSCLNTNPLHLWEDTARHIPSWDEEIEAQFWNRRLEPV